MSFQWPAALLLLALIPVLVALYIWMQSRRRRYALRYASVSLVAQAVGRGPGIRRHIPAVLYFVAIAAMIVALARPEATVPSLQNSGTIILVIDVSGSMAAEDVRPNRMEATKEAARDFVNKQPSGVKIGVVAFSDYAALVAPPTGEHKPVLDALARLRPQRSTNIGAGLQVALDAIYEVGDSAGPSAIGEPTPTPTPGTKAPAASIVLVSDGESKVGPPPLEIADEAAQAGVKIYSVGIGTAEGTVLRIQGQNVFTSLDEPTLRGIAERTEGRYFSAQDESSLKQIYDELARERLIENKRTEITFAFAAAALVVSMVAGGLGLLWFNRLP
jgi:Ca-activated chloride channel family protein